MHSRHELLELAGAILSGARMNGDQNDIDKVTELIDKIDESFPPVDQANGFMVWVDGINTMSPVIHEYHPDNRDSHGHMQTACGMKIRMNQRSAFMLAHHALRFATPCAPCAVRGAEFYE
jgi:hypothetical protein